MSDRALSRDEILSSQHALTEEEFADLMDRCPPEHHWAFGPYLRGERDLAGDLIAGSEPDSPSS